MNTAPTLDLDIPAGEPVIRYRRFVAAPPDLLYRVFTEPEHLRNWWGPRALELVVCDVDLRVGGAFRFVSRAPDGGEHPFSGEFLVLDRPHAVAMRIAYEPMPDAAWVDHATFEEADGGTYVAGTSTFESVEARDAHVASGMESGMRESFERLDELVAALP